VRDQPDDAEFGFSDDIDWATVAAGDQSESSIDLTQDSAQSAAEKKRASLAQRQADKKRRRKNFGPGTLEKESDRFAAELLRKKAEEEKKRDAEDDTDIIGTKE